MQPPINGLYIYIYIHSIYNMDKYAKPLYFAYFYILFGQLQLAMFEFAG